MCSSAFCTVLPCGSNTAFLGVTIILAFIVKIKSGSNKQTEVTPQRIIVRECRRGGERFFVNFGDAQRPGRFRPLEKTTEICFAPKGGQSYFCCGLSDGVMVAQGPLEAFVMVRIHVGQPLPSY